jgi:hypothetical protein
MGPGSLIAPDGKDISREDSPYVWLGHLLEDPGLTKPVEAIPVHLYLLVAITYGHALRYAALAHTHCPGMLLLGACTMSLDYAVIFLVPLAFSDSGTGKTTALQCGLALGGASNGFFSQGMKEKCLDLCCKSTIPIGGSMIHPFRKTSTLCLDLFNSAKSGSITRGEKKPHTTAIIAANFPTSSKEK